MFQCLECPYNSKDKSNYNRHIIKKHKKIINNVITSNPNVITSNPNVITSNPNVITSNPNVITSNPNVITSNPNVIHSNKCHKCHKILSSKSNLTKHMKTCCGTNKKECKFCHKVLSSIQYKDKHQLICKDKDKPTTIINNTTNIQNNTTNIQNITNIQNNIDNSVNIVVFNSDPKRTTKFDTEHITSDVLIKIFKQSMNNIMLCSKLLDAIWENVNNRCIIKPNMKTKYSKVSGENGSWLSVLDLDTYPKYLKDGYKTTKKLLNKLKQELSKKLNENTIDEIYNNLDDYENLDMDDKQLTDAYLIEDNFFRGYSKEECEDIRKNQKNENEKIEEYQRNYKRYRLKASDNAKRLT
jgi:hypothetical protein